MQHDSLNSVASSNHRNPDIRTSFSSDRSSIMQIHMSSSRSAAPVGLYLTLIFLTGATTLALELLASRVMTPYFGVSLYIWTGILSITLVALALGYYLGGRLAGREGARSPGELEFRLQHDPACLDRFRGPGGRSPPGPLFLTQDSDPAPGSSCDSWPEAHLRPP